jgi:hypothetical protein
MKAKEERERYRLESDNCSSRINRLDLKDMSMIQKGVTEC